GMRHLLGAPALAGGNLLPVTDELSALFSKAASGWSYAGAGAPGYDGPFGWLLVLFGLTGNASTVRVWIWILALPLAGSGAWMLVAAGLQPRLYALPFPKDAAAASWFIWPCHGSCSRYYTPSVIEPMISTYFANFARIVPSHQARCYLDEKRLIATRPCR